MQIKTIDFEKEPRQIDGEKTVSATNEHPEATGHPHAKNS